MGTIISITVFTLLTIIAFAISGKKYYEIYQKIKLGKPENNKGNFSERIKNTLLVALGQKKMFKRITPAILHLFVYLAFLVTQIELIEIFIDGFTGQHRIIWQAVENTFLSTLYLFTINFIEFLSLFALIATFIFLYRRNIMRIARFKKPEMKGWPTLDANLILFMEIFLVSCIFIMNSTDQALHPEANYRFFLSGFLVHMWDGVSPQTLHVLERFGWWGHFLGVLLFLNYLPYSKHLHIMLAFPNVFFARLEPNGYVENMPEVTKEIKLMMDPNAASATDTSTEELPKFGAKDIQDLSWRNLLNAYTCTECGRCTNACPANKTGKKLSPRKVMMDTRDRVEEVALNIKKNKGTFKDDGKSLLHNYISVEELRACTTCNACVEECPVSINPLDIIIQLRRNLILEESNSPEEWNVMFGNIENNGAPWAYGQQDRANWVEELKKETVEA